MGYQKSKKWLIISLLVVISGASWLFFVFDSLPAQAGFSVSASVVYRIETHQFDTGQVFSETLLGPNDTRLDINFPTDSLSSGAEIEMTFFSLATSAVISAMPLPSEKLSANTLYKFSFNKTSDNSAVTSFDQPVTLTFYYTDADIGSIDENTLAPYRWSGTSWVLVSGSAIDTSAKKVTVATQQFSYFSLLGTAPSSGNGGSSGSSGGGGGGSYTPPETKVVFSGRAYPKSVVTLLKDAQIAATVIADANANFQISVSGLSGGNFIFSVYSEDSKGNRSSLLTFPISVTSGVTVQTGGIFIAPTIAVDKEEVKKEDNIAIFGQSAPQADIVVSVNSDEEFFGKTIADANGNYLYNFDTSVIDYGMHYAKSKASISNLEISSFSGAIGFKVGTKTTLAKPITTPAKGDLNSDKRVNLVDFSIAAYWYKRPNPPATADLNGDGKVDLVDFSIMAYHWTG